MLWSGFEATCGRRWRREYDVVMERIPLCISYNVRKRVSLS